MNAHPTDDNARPFWSQVLKSIREARGLSQGGWSARLGVSERTIRRWERGDVVPGATDERTLLDFCHEHQLYQPFTQGPLRGRTLTPQLLREVLAAARLGERGGDNTAAPAAGHEERPPAALSAPPSHPATAERAASLAAPTNLPVPMTGLVGREAELQALRGLFSATRLLTLTGAGGVGKTRLATELSRALLPEHPDGAWFADFAALDDASLLVPVVAGACGLVDVSSTALPDILLAYLRPRALLLVLDNCEHLVEDCAALAEWLLSACPHLRILATSREPLRAAGETVYRVPGLSLPSPDRDGDGHHNAAESGAVRLFMERAGAVNHALALTPETQPAVTRICHELAGMPLALELAAARTAALTVEQIAARLDDSLALLTSGRRTAPARQQTLRAAIDWSVALLAQPEQTLFARLAVFAGGFDLEAAEAVCAGDDLGVPAVAGLLAALVEKSLVQAEERVDEARYRLLPPLRSYAVELLRGASKEAAPRTGAGTSETAVRRRHLDFYLALAGQAGPRLRGPAQEVWLARLDQEHDNLRAALRWSLAPEHETEEALRLAAALAPFWERRGRLTEGRRWLADALKQPGDPSPWRARALNAAGDLAWRQSDYEPAQAFYNESLAISARTGDQAGRAWALTDLGYIAHVRADYATARMLLDEALSIYAATGDRWGEALTRNRLGLMARAQADFPRARALLERALTLWQETGDPRAVSTAHNNLGILAYFRADYQAARGHYARSLVLKQETGDTWGMSLTLGNLGVVAHAQGDYAAARALYEQQLALAGELGHRRAAANALRYLGQTAQAEQNLTAARDFFDQSLAVFRELGDRRGITSALSDLGLVAADLGDEAEAGALLEEALAMSRQLGDRLSTANALAHLARLALRRGDTTPATSHLRSALQIWQGLSSPRDLAQCLQQCGLLAAETGRSRQAVWLLAADDALRTAIAAPLPPPARLPIEQTLDRLRAALGAEAFDSEWTAGLDATPAHAVTVALAEVALESDTGDTRYPA
jgi:predicted ATPase/transcriptional regulator with XRE-family HTH domain